MYYIAICDDNVEFLQVMEKAIEENPEYNEDMTFYLFLSGKELLNSNVEKYDLVILDMHMENMDGYMTAKEVRRKNENRYK